MAEIETDVSETTFAVTPYPEDVSPSTLCDRDRMLLALASRPPLSREVGEEIIRVVQEAREASIASQLDGEQTL